MSTVNVTNSTTGTMGTLAAKRTRYEKMETAYGKIPAAAYNVGDTLSFINIPLKHLIYAKFAATNDQSSITEIELFAGSNLSAPITFDVGNDNASSDIHYVINYVRGTGLVMDGISVQGEGHLIQLTIASSCV